MSELLSPLVSIRKATKRLPVLRFRSVSFDDYLNFRLRADVEDLVVTYDLVAPTELSHVVGLFDEDAAVGMGVVRPVALPQSSYRKAWCISGLLLVQSVLSEECGTELVGYLLGICRNESAPLVWCDAERSSLPLLRSFGFTSTAGEQDSNLSTRMTCRSDNIVSLNTKADHSEADIIRIGNLPRLSRAVIYGNVIHIGGLLPNRSDVSIGDQTGEILEKIDTILEFAGSSRTRILSATVWVKDLAGVAEANRVWEAWLPPGASPARACVEAAPGSREYQIEIAATAAV